MRIDDGKFAYLDVKFRKEACRANGNERRESRVGPEELCKGVLQGRGKVVGDDETERAKVFRITQTAF